MTVYWYKIVIDAHAVCIAQHRSSADVGMSNKLYCTFLITFTIWHACSLCEIDNTMVMFCCIESFNLISTFNMKLWGLLIRR